LNFHPEGRFKPPFVTRSDPENGQNKESGIIQDHEPAPAPGDTVHCEIAQGIEKWGREKGPRVGWYIEQDVDNPGGKRHSQLPVQPPENGPDSSSDNQAVGYRICNIDPAGQDIKRRLTSLKGTVGCADSRPETERKKVRANTEKKSESEPLSPACQHPAPETVRQNIHQSPPLSTMIAT
jgi:hypothetical protein